jgi:hypothetical protein
MRALLVLASAAALVGLAACEKRVEAPTDRGICWHMVLPTKSQVRFNKVAQKVDTIEKCAAELEGMRLRFTALGSSNQQIIGAYQGQFLFLQPEGIFVGATLNGGRYLLLVRTGDGRLAKPGVLPVE